MYVSGHLNNSFTHFFPYNSLAYKNIQVTSKKKKIKNDTQDTPE